MIRISYSWYHLYLLNIPITNMFVLQALSIMITFFSLQSNKNMQPIKLSKILTLLDHHARENFVHFEMVFIEYAAAHCTKLYNINNKQLQ